MSQIKIYLCLPILNESENIGRLLQSLKQQSFQNFELIACVNQLDSWWETEDKIAQCIDNQKSIEILSSKYTFPVITIDKSSKGNGWQGKQKGVGWARKMAMDKAASLGEKDDIILSIDADTFYPNNFLETVKSIFLNQKKIVGLANPYYHKLTADENANRAILRYEIYMRNYAINMLLIDNPYHYTALGSAMGTTVAIYKKMGGISPKVSGEDFYFLQKLRKFGSLADYNAVKVYPASRFSDRVNFGTGPAMIKGDAGDWSSYPIYHFQLFEKIKKTYDLFPELFLSDCETPMTAFLQNQLKKEDIWSALRKNYKTKEQFVKACSTLVDGLRILQFLKQEVENENLIQEQNLKDNLMYFSKIKSIYSIEFERFTQVVDFKNLSFLIELREALVNFEYSLRKMKSKY